jgi:hypothetical protein
MQISEMCKGCPKKETCAMINNDIPMPPPEVMQLAMMLAVLNAELQMIEDEITRMQTQGGRINPMMN